MGAWTVINVGPHRVDCFAPGTQPPCSLALIHLRDRHDPAPADDSVLTAELEQHQFLTLSPATCDHWWLDRIVPEFDESTSPLAWLRVTLAVQCRTLWNIAPPRIGLLGSGIGGNGALQLAYRSPRDFPVVAAISPAVDFHSQYDLEPVLQSAFSSAESARQETATLRLHPLNWPPHQWFGCDPRDPLWSDGCDRLASKLRSIGIPFEGDLTTSAGCQRADYRNLMLPTAVGFIAERLKSVANSIS